MEESSRSGALCTVVHRCTVHKDFALNYYIYRGGAFINKQNRNMFANVWRWWRIMVACKRRNYSRIIIHVYIKSCIRMSHNSQLHDLYFICSSHIRWPNYVFYRYNFTNVFRSFAFLYPLVCFFFVFFKKQKYIIFFPSHLMRRTRMEWSSPRDLCRSHRCDFRGEILVVHLHCCCSLCAAHIKSNLTKNGQVWALCKRNW